MNLDSSLPGHRQRPRHLALGLTQRRGVIELAGRVPETQPEHLAACSIDVLAQLGLAQVALVAGIHSFFCITTFLHTVTLWSSRLKRLQAVLAELDHDLATRDSATTAAELLTVLHALGREHQLPSCGAAPDSPPLLGVLFPDDPLDLRLRLADRDLPRPAVSESLPRSPPPRDSSAAAVASPRAPGCGSPRPDPAGVGPLRPAGPLRPPAPPRPAPPPRPRPSRPPPAPPPRPRPSRPPR